MDSTMFKFAAFCVVFMGFSDAWMAGDGGKVLWDNKCDFQGPDLLNQQAPAGLCGGICIFIKECTHWTWTNYLAGTCWLKSGDMDRVTSNPDASCGFLSERFRVDETQDFDLDAGFGRNTDNPLNVLTSEEASSWLVLINFYRSVHGKQKLLLDARLILAAKAISASCPSENTQNAMMAHKRGFKDEVYLLTSVTSTDTSISDALDPWTSLYASNASTEPLLNDEIALVGFAKRANTNCVPPTHTNAAQLTTVWTMLLGKAQS